MFRVERSVTVITPSIGKPEVADAIRSVSEQTYKNIHHLVVMDGPEYESLLDDAMAYGNVDYPPNIDVTVAPYNTGANGFYGHRIYAAYPHLVDSDYVFFLDEDNWWDENHVLSLVNLIESKNLLWVHSLRKIWTPEKNLVDIDNCESLGRYPIYGNEANGYLVDTSSYAFKREFLTQVCQHWHWGWGGDRRFFNIVWKQLGEERFGCSNLHTLNYRLDENMLKKYGTSSFFADGNKLMHEKYGDTLPWQ